MQKRNNELEDRKKDIYFYYRDKGEDLKTNLMSHVGNKSKTNEEMLAETIEQYKTVKETIKRGSLVQCVYFAYLDLIKRGYRQF